MFDRTISKSIELVDSKGIKKGGTTIAVVAGVGLFAAGVVYWFKCKNKTKVIDVKKDAQKVLDDNKTKNTIIVDMAKTDNDIRKNSAATDDKIRLEEAKAEAKLEVLKTKEALYAARNNGSEESNSQTVEDTTIPPSYDEVIQQNADLSLDKLSINGTRLFWYDTVGVVGLNNGGKSTLLRQIASSFSTGHQEVKLFPDWKNSSGVGVLLFAFEHNGGHFKNYDANQHKSYPNLRIETKVNSISKFKDIITKTAAAYPNGLVVIIDNYTKLQQMVNKRPNTEMGKLANWMDMFMKQRQEERKPFTIINVFHTVKDYKPTTPLELCHVAGDANYTRFCQGFIALSECRWGENYRILKELKNKYLEKPTTVSIVRYADNPIKMYEYVEEAKENEVLPNGCAAGGRNDIKPSGQKRGRRTDMSVEEAISYWDKVNSNEITWAEIEKATGKSMQAIKKRCKRNGYNPTDNH